MEESLFALIGFVAIVAIVILIGWCIYELFCFIAAHAAIIFGTLGGITLVTCLIFAIVCIADAFDKATKLSEYRSVKDGEAFKVIILGPLYAYLFEVFCISFAEMHSRLRSGMDKSNWLILPMVIGYVGTSLWLVAIFLIIYYYLVHISLFYLIIMLLIKSIERLYLFIHSISYSLKAGYQWQHRAN